MSQQGSTNPSREVSVADVPEVKNLKVNFVYNYFVPDEKLNEASGIPDKVVSNRSILFDPNLEKSFTSRIPRYVDIQWKPVLSPGEPITPFEGNVIASNLDKIISEDSFSNKNFIGVTFQDADIDSKIFSMLSGTLEQLRLTEEIDSGLNYEQSSLALSNLLPNISKDFVTNGLVQPTRSHGARYYSNNPQDSLNEDAYLSTKIHASLAKDMINRIITDPQSSYDADLHDIYSRISTIISNTNSQNSDVTIQPIRHQVISNLGENPNKMKIAGFVIDKYELLDNGNYQRLGSIVIENPSINSLIDPFIKYGKTYCYSVKTISMLTMVLIDRDTTTLGLADILVSSKPVKKYVTTTETLAPQPPTDILFFWDYETDKLVLSWSFPTNPQRDIKKFQVFRRQFLTDAFELIKEYDFNDSLVKSANLESPEKRLVETKNSPSTVYIDDDFKKDSVFIYALCSVDAHGFTSCYSSQYRTTFDIFKNELTYAQISQSGAPKQYPNMYVRGRGFTNVGYVNGNYSKRAFLYFTPQFYQLKERDGKINDVVSTNQNGGSYKFQFINVDNQKSEILNVKIENTL
jgi:hypothetical protein